MAVGDVINGLTPASTALTFQPAAGVECMISCASSWVSGCTLTNGTNVAYFADTTSGSAGLTSGNVGNLKLFINNTIYVGLLGGTSSCLYTGIQIK